AVAVGARRGAGQPQRHRHTLGGLEEVELGLGLKILAAPWPTGPRLGAAAAEQPTEEVADIGSAVLPGLAEQVVEIEAPAAVVATATAATAGETAPEAAGGEQPPGFVVLGPFGLVG